MICMLKVVYSVIDHAHTQLQDSARRNDDETSVGRFTTTSCSGSDDEKSNTGAGRLFSLS